MIWILTELAMSIGVDSLWQEGKGFIHIYMYMYMYLYILFLVVIAYFSS